MGMSPLCKSQYGWQHFWIILVHCSEKTWGWGCRNKNNYRIRTFTIPWHLGALGINGAKNSHMKNWTELFRKIPCQRRPWTSSRRLRPLAPRTPSLRSRSWTFWHWRSVGRRCLGVGAHERWTSGQLFWLSWLSGCWFRSFLAFHQLVGIDDPNWHKLTIFWLGWNQPIIDELSYGTPTDEPGSYWGWPGELLKWGAEDGCSAWSRKTYGIF